MMSSCDNVIESGLIHLRRQITLHENFLSKAGSRGDTDVAIRQEQILNRLYRQLRAEEAEL